MRIYRKLQELYTGHVGGIRDIEGLECALQACRIWVISNPGITAQ